MRVPGESYFEFILLMLMRIIEIVVIHILNQSINFLKRVRRISMKQSNVLLSGVQQRRLCGSGLCTDAHSKASGDFLQWSMQRSYTLRCLRATCACTH